MASRDFSDDKWWHCNLNLAGYVKVRPNPALPLLPAKWCSSPHSREAEDGTWSLGRRADPSVSRHSG